MWLGVFEAVAVAQTTPSDLRPTPRGLPPVEPPSLPSPAGLVRSLPLTTPQVLFQQQASEFGDGVGAQWWVPGACPGRRVFSIPEWGLLG